MASQASRQYLLRLVQAILTRVRDRDGYGTKTKLIKYLYLIDIAHFRQTGRLLTGFHWIFHYYGPWAQEYETLYQEAVRSGTIRVRPGTRPELDVEFVESPEVVELSETVNDWRLEREVRDIVDTWADRRLGEMLDYVYFETEPMEAVARGEDLDFSSVEHEEVEIRPWEPPRGDQMEAKQARRRIAERLASRERTQPDFTPPRYDEEYFEALQVIDEDEEE